MTHDGKTKNYPKKTDCSFGIGLILVTLAVFATSTHIKHKIPKKTQKIQKNLDPFSCSLMSWSARSARTDMQRRKRCSVCVSSAFSESPPTSPSGVRCRPRPRFCQATCCSVTPAGIRPTEPKRELVGYVLALFSCHPCHARTRGESKKSQQFCVSRLGLS